MVYRPIRKGRAWILGIFVVGLLGGWGYFWLKVSLPITLRVQQAFPGSWAVRILPYWMETLPLLAGAFFFLIYLHSESGKFVIQKIRQCFSRVKPRTEDEKEQLTAFLRIILGRDGATDQPVAIEGKDRFLHTYVQGPTGCGKTSAVLKPAIYQDLLRMAKGEKLGLTVIEPSGDLALWVAEECKALGIPCLHIDPERSDTKRFNPLEGEPAVVAEAARTVLKSLFGKQDPFFSQIQEALLRNAVLLLKKLQGDNLDLIGLARFLRNQGDLRRAVGEYKRRYGADDLSEYFEEEVFGQMEDKFFQFTAGIRQQLADLVGSEGLRRVFSGQSDVILEQHLAEGGQVLAVNTAMGRLGKMGDTLGQFLLMHLQSTVFRRPGDEWSRVPHFLVVDEFPLYRNPDFGRFLAIARKYRCGAMLAVQNASQLESEDRAFLPTVLNNCRNKIWFGGLSEEEALAVEKECGMAGEEVKKEFFEHQVLLPAIFPERFSLEERLIPRFPYTYIMELAPFHIIYKIVRNNRPLPPGEAICTFFVGGASRGKPNSRPTPLPTSFPTRPQPIFEPEGIGAARSCTRCGGPMHKKEYGMEGWFAECPVCHLKEAIG